MDFEWGIHFVGQTDTSICTSGVDLVAAVKQVFVRGGRLWLYNRILVGAVDGCHAMRSTRKYAGLHPRTEGTSFLKLLQEDLAKQRQPPGFPPVSLAALLLFFHCILHILALAFLDALKVLPPHVIPHILSFHAMYNNSLKGWAELLDICKDLKLDMTKVNALDANPITDKELHRITAVSLPPTRSLMPHSSCSISSITASELLSTDTSQ